MGVRKATLADKSWTIAVIADAFRTNRSANWVVQSQDRIEGLIAYAFIRSFRSGGVLVHEDGSCAALLLDPSGRNHVVRNALEDLNLAFTTIGLGKVFRVLKRERYVRRFHPRTAFIHL